MDKTIEEALKYGHGLRVAFIDNKLFYDLCNGMFLREDGKLSYICALCNTPHDTYEAYAACVQKCAKQKKDEEERKHREELAEKKQERLDSIKEMQAKLNEQIQSYVDDYGEIRLNNYRRECCSPFSDLWPFSF